jgi:hypothetical protein
MTSLLGPRLIVPVLGVLIFLTAAALLLPSRAEAGLRVQARVITPHVQVQVANGPDHYRVERIRNPYIVHRAKVDRKIARKLAQRTRYGMAVFLDLRSAGYSWKKIGRILHIHPRLIRRTVAAVEADWGYHQNRPNWRNNRGGKYKGHGNRF